MKTQIKKWMSIMFVISVLALMPLSAFASPVATVNNGEITISGTMEGAREVTVLVVTHGASINNLSASELAYVNQVPAANGAYSLTFTMPEGKRTGTYDVYVGAANAATPDATSYTFPTAAPTEAPSAAPSTPPAIDMATAKPAVNGSNAFYYVVSITLNDGEATAFTAKHYPSDLTEDVATSDTISLQGIAGTTIKLITVLKDIPLGQENREITSKVILTYTIGGNPGSVEDSETTTLNQIRPNN